jgi:hypothetical protein
MGGVWVEIGFACLALGLLGFALWELVALRRDKRRSRSKDRTRRPD